MSLETYVISCLSLRSRTQELRDTQEQLQLKRDHVILLETRLNDADHKLARLSERSADISTQASVEQADNRHKAAIQVS